MNKREKMSQTASAEGIIRSYTAEGKAISPKEIEIESKKRDGVIYFPGNPGTRANALVNKLGSDIRKDNFGGSGPKYYVYSHGLDIKKLKNTEDFNSIGSKKGKIKKNKKNLSWDKERKEIEKKAEENWTPYNILQNKRIEQAVKELNKYFTEFSFSKDHSLSLVQYREKAHNPDLFQILTNTGNSGKNYKSEPKMTIDAQISYLRGLVHTEKTRNIDFCISSFNSTLDLIKSAYKKEI